MCLLPQLHPQIPIENPDMYEMQMHHASQICGIDAHVKDRSVPPSHSFIVVFFLLTVSRGVAAAAIRCLAVGGEPLVDFKQQQEVLTIFEKIKKETGFRVGFICDELMKKWGWTEDYVRAQTQQNHYPQQPQPPQQQAMQSMLHTPPMEYGGFNMPMQPSPHQQHHQHQQTPHQPQHGHSLQPPPPS